MEDNMDIDIEKKPADRVVLNIDKILDEARVLGCSDVHFTTKISPIVRLHGTLRKLSSYPEMTDGAIMKLVEQMTGGRNIENIKNRIDTDFSYVTKRGYRHRVNVYHQRGDTAIAIRLLRNDIPTLEDLDMPPILGDFAMRPRGLILVTGPTGSGKSTTLASLIDRINDERNAHVITLEDPIEYLHTHRKSMINQREIGIDTQSYAKALRSALREDPDVILVGEMRDLETISTAITAAETGHLVFSTLHTIGAAATIDRIIDVFPPHQQQQIRVQLSMVLESVISQQLIPTADKKSRVAAFEVMHSTPAIKNLIREAKSPQINSTIQTSKKLGMQTMDDAIFDLYMKGDIDKENAVSYAQDSQIMEKRIDNAF